MPADGGMGDLAHDAFAPSTGGTDETDKEEGEEQDEDVLDEDLEEYRGFPTANEEINGTDKEIVTHPDTEGADGEL